MAACLIDVSHTSHTRAQTGIQRVVRSLVAALAGSAEPVTFDPFLHGWRKLESWEQANLAASDGATRRSAQWPLTARWRGRTRRLFGRAPQPLSASEGIVVPELFSPQVASALPELSVATPGPRVALFHDAIALKLPELAPAKTVARYPAYLQELLQFDGIAAVSDDSRQTLLDYWRWLGVSRTPEVRTIPLGIHQDARIAAVPASAETSLPPPSTDVPVILCVGSIEGRKNHRALFDACERLWARGSQFELQVVGMARPETAADALERMRALQTAGRPLRHDGAADDQALEQAYTRCLFTVYPSLLEGFGLPVLESIAHGKPCVTSGHGALGESARGGGCLLLESVDAESIAYGLDRLLSDPAQLARLRAEAEKRRLRSWAEYAAELTGWMHALRPRR